MNYSETSFELDSEEATHCHLISCVYIKGHVKMVDTKDQSNAIVYCEWYVVCQHCQYEDQSMQGTLMFVKTVDTGVCGSYTTLYTEYCEVLELYSTLHKVASHPSKGEGYLEILLSYGFNCSPVSLRRQLC